MKQLAVYRYKGNPIISPDKNNSWESYATFNGCPIKNEHGIDLLYRAIGQEIEESGKKLRISTIGFASSFDGRLFSQRRLLLSPNYDWEKYGCEDPRVVYFEGKYYIFYTAISSWPPTASSIKIAVALTSDLTKIDERHLVTPFNAKAMAIFPERINGKIVAILTVNTDMPPAKICLAYFDVIEDLWSPQYWNNWYREFKTHSLHLQRSRIDHIELGSAPIKTPYGWFFVYSYIKHYFTPKKEFRIEAALLDLENPDKIIGIIDTPILIPEHDYEVDGAIQNIVFPSGAIIKDDALHIYYGASDEYCSLATIPLNNLYENIRTTATIVPKLKRFEGNPILEPISSNPWEAQAVFNPAAICKEGKVYIIYRAMSNDNTSTMGYASSSNGFTIDERFDEPIYYPREYFEEKKVINGFSGCEDPRLTEIDDDIYMLYTAYTGMRETRVAMTSIKSRDFVDKKWNWTKPVLISPPGVFDKDACIFPKKINNKYVILHRVDGAIVIDWEDNLDFDGNRWLKCENYITSTTRLWEADKIGISSPPHYSDKGWVQLYHGVSNHDTSYRIGAMLLDLNDPSKVLARTKYPIIEPETTYEKEGIVPNVVFPCGSVIKNGILYVYYGGADKVVGVASYPYDPLVDYLDGLYSPKYLR